MEYNFRLYPGWVQRDSHNCCFNVLRCSNKLDYHSVFLELKFEAMIFFFNSFCCLLVHQNSTHGIPLFAPEYCTYVKIIKNIVLVVLANEKSSRFCRKAKSI